MTLGIHTGIDVEQFILANKLKTFLTALLFILYADFVYQIYNEEYKIKGWKPSSIIGLSLVAIPTILPQWNNNIQFIFYNVVFILSFLAIKVNVCIQNLPFEICEVKGLNNSSV